MTALVTPEHRDWLADETGRLLAFGRASCPHPAGGFAWLSDTGRPMLDRPAELWITCRMTHVFALGHLLREPGCAELVDHGVASLTGPFRDAVNGGWYAAVDAAGPTTRGKAAYPHAFVVLAASSAVAAGRPGAEDLLSDALEVLLGRFWDDEHGMVVEEWDETFTDLDPYRGVNANMHTVEALLAANGVTGDRSLLDRALRIVTRVVHELAPAHRWRIPEHFDADWRPLLDYNRDAPADPFRPYGATIGHWLEWARLALHLSASLGDEAPAWLLEDARALFDASIREGWAVDGGPGFVYTVDWEGRPVVRERMHWVAAEAIAAAAALHRATGEEEYAAWYRRWWDHVRDVFVDEEHGSWHHELDPANRPSATVWDGKPDAYHAVQASLLPRLPLAPAFASALAADLLDT